MQELVNGVGSLLQINLLIGYQKKKKNLLIHDHGSQGTWDNPMEPLLALHTCAYSLFMYQGKHSKAIKIFTLYMRVPIL